MSGGQQQCGAVQQQTPEQTLDHVCGGPVGSSSQSGIRGLLDPGCTYEGPHGATRQTRRPIPEEGRDLAGRRTDAMRGQARQGRYIDGIPGISRRRDITHVRQEFPKCRHYFSNMEY